MTGAVFRGAGRKAIVFQHGLCGDAQQTFEIMPLLPDWQLSTLECAGHGASLKSGPYSIAQFANEVTELIETLPRPVVLGGISMGAAIATRIAVLRPDLIRGLVLIRPAWLCDAAPPNMGPNAEVGRAIATKGGRSAFQRSITAQNLAATAPDNLASLMGFFDREPLSQTAALLTSIAADGPGISRAELMRITVPTLICGTRQDAVHPLAIAIELAALIPTATLTELPPKGLNKPLHLAAAQTAITDFLQEF